MAQGDRTQEHKTKPLSDFKGKATDTFEKLAESTTDQVGRIAEQVEGVAAKVAEQGRNTGQQAQQVAGSLKTAVQKSVRDQPIATLAIAAAAAFALGALWKLRPDRR